MDTMYQAMSDGVKSVRPPANQHQLRYAALRNAAFVTGISNSVTRSKASKMKYGTSNHWGAPTIREYHTIH